MTSVHPVLLDDLPACKIEEDFHASSLPAAHYADCLDCKTLKNPGSA
jgi:hypothetical protein